jgi:hypothetical protein
LVESDKDNGSTDLGNISIRDWVALRRPKFTIFSGLLLKHHQLPPQPKCLTLPQTLKLSWHVILSTRLLSLCSLVLPFQPNQSKMALNVWISRPRPLLRLLHIVLLCLHLLPQLNNLSLVIPGRLNQVKLLLLLLRLSNRLKHLSLVLARQLSTLKVHKPIQSHQLKQSNVCPRH